MSIFVFTWRWHSQYPDKPEVITANLLKLTECAPNPYVTYTVYNATYVDARGRDWGTDA